MDWNHVLGWGSPIGLGVFLMGLGTILKTWMHRGWHGGGAWQHKDWHKDMPHGQWNKGMPGKDWPKEK